jgi:cyclohexadienyl dehydratase
LWSELTARARRLAPALVLVVCWAAATAASAPAGSPDGATLRLYELIAARLSLMRDVAAYKWIHDLPIEDAEREAVVIEAAQTDGLRRLLRPESVRPFFALQIGAAKDIQRYWFERWRAGAAPTEAPDLAAEVRPRLLTLGSDIVDALGSWDPTAADRPAFREVVTVAGLTDTRVDRLFDALVEIRRFGDRLAQIRATGVLRVGTTGDYAPFSHAVDGASYEGIDIDLARDLADGLNARVVFVRTSWPTLLDDLATGSWDIAMSGISRTEARAREGDLSDPYFVGGKTPIARCADRERFNSLQAIDTPGVRVIVNPGGTNEAFVDAHIVRATKVLHSDNRTIFDALAAGTADVMITDQIEVALQTRRHPALCGTMAGTLTRQEKGFLMPRDDVWKNYVDAWLASRLEAGMVERLIEEHLGR